MEYPLDHVAIALPSIEAVLPAFELVTGSAGSRPERVESQHVNVVFMGPAGCRLELIEPTDTDSPISRFLDRRGPGLHHIAYRVPDIETALARLADEGFQLIDEVPRDGALGHRVAFIHPRSTHGVLIELVQR